ncbi:MAG TPA: YggT family protein [Ktedonobacterales bacterium]|nr:YggT family protein [Ktedonobacterales bacterium]
MYPNDPVQPREPVRPVEYERPVEPAPVAYRRDVTTEVSPAYRFAQFIYVVFGVGITLIIIRVILKALAANPDAGFTSFLYGVTNPLVAPFQGIFATPQAGTGSVFELSSIIAIIVYALIAWALVRLVVLMGRRRTTTTSY